MSLFEDLQSVPETYHETVDTPVAQAWFGQDYGPTGNKYRPFDEVPSDPKEMPRFLIGSRFSFSFCFLILCTLLPEGVMGSFILSWLIDMILEEAERTEQFFLAGTISHDQWFWSALMGLAAVSGVPATNELERIQMQVWRRALHDKIRLANKVLGLHDWKSAKVPLRRIAWLDGFDGEAEMRQLWEEAAGQITDRSLQQGYGLPARPGIE